MIATFITEHCSISALCYGVKKSAKNIGSDLNITAKLSIIVDGGKSELYRLHESLIIKDYSILHNNLETSLIISYVKEVILYISQGSMSDECLILMEKTLDAMLLYVEKNCSGLINILMRAFEIKALSICGIAPAFKRCSICQTTESQNWYYIFDIATVICKNCYQNDRKYKTLYSQNITKETLDIIRQLKHSPLIKIVENIENYKHYSKDIDKDIRYITMSRLTDYIGHSIKSLAVIDSILL